MNKFLKQKNSGFTLLETLVAISIFTVSLLGIMSVLASSISNTTYAKQKMTATYLAQEGIEQIRNLRDTYVLFYTPDNKDDGWRNFKNDTTRSIVSLGGFQESFPSTYNSDGFTRTISVSAPQIQIANEVQISSTVSWTTGSGDHSVTLSEDLFNWIE